MIRFLNADQTFNTKIKDTLSKIKSIKFWNARMRCTIYISTMNSSFWFYEYEHKFAKMILFEVIQFSVDDIDKTRQKSHR